MTVVVNSHTNENYYIVLEIENGMRGSYYQVQVYPRISECECGYPIRNMIYGINEKEKALATFRRYKRKYTGTQLEIKSNENLER